MTPTGNWRLSILRMYWDDETEPSVEVPVGDFFAMGWGKYAQVSSLAVCVNPGSAFNCVLADAVPAARRRITIENLDEKPMELYYQIDYALAAVPDGRCLLPRPVSPSESAAVQAGLHDPRRSQRQGSLRRHLHGVGRAQQRAGGARARSSSTSTATRTSQRSTGPAPRTTSTVRTTSRTVRRSSTRRSRARTRVCVQVIKPDGLYQSQQRFGLYRWHIADPVRFNSDLRVTIQALGWRDDSGRYLPLRDDIASVAYWYQDGAARAVPEIAGEGGTRNELSPRRGALRDGACGALAASRRLR